MKKIKNKYFFNSAIFVKFLILGVMFGLIIVLISGFIKYKFVEKEMKIKMEDILKEKVQLIDEFINEEEKEFYKVYDEKLFLNFLENEEKEMEFENPQFKILQNYFLSNNKSLGLVNSSGIIILDNNKDLIGFNISTYPESVKYLKDAGSELNYRVLPHPMEDAFYLLLNKKIYDDSNNFFGVFSYRLLDDSLKSFLDEVDDFESFAEGYLINKDYVLITPSKHISGEDKGLIVQIVNTSNSIDCLNILSSLGKIKNEFIFGEVKDYNSYWGGEVFGQYVAMNKLNWCLFVEVDKQGFFGDYFYSLLFTEGISFLVIVLLFILFSYLKYKEIVKC
jgi:hypothetical protein